MVGDGLQSPEIESGGSDDGFFPLKPASIDPTGALTKFGEIRISRQVFGQNTLDFYEIWGDVTKSREISARSSGNLTGSGEISLNPMRFPLDLAKISLDSMTSPKIRPKSHKNLMYFDQKLAGKFLFRWISLRLRSSRLRRVLEERTRHPTRRTRFLGFAIHRRPPELTDQSRVSRFRSGLVGWIGSSSSWTPLPIWSRMSPRWAIFSLQLGL